MKASPESKTKNSNMNRKGALALILVGVLSPAASTSAHGQREKMHKQTRIEWLAEKSTRELYNQLPLKFFKGALIIEHTNDTGGARFEQNNSGGAAYTNGSGVMHETEIIENPILVEIKSNPTFGPNDLTSGVYAFGKIIHRNTRPEVRLYKYNPASMTLLYPETQDQNLVYAVSFELDKGSYPNLQRPFGAHEGAAGKGGPLMDPYSPEIPLQIAIERNQGG